QAEAIGIEINKRWRAIGTVASEEHWIAAIAFQTFPIDERDGNARAVRRRRVKALGFVARSIVAAENFSPLQQFGFAFVHVVIENGARRDQGLVAVSENRGSEFRVGDGEGGIRRFRKLNAMGLAGAEVHDAKVRQAVLAL